MLNINFVPDDYIQSSESHRTNFLYLILFAIVMTILSGVFITIKIRQHSLNAKENEVNEKMSKAQESIEQLEELQTKRKTMMKTALTTSELIEPVPKSVLLACLTNNLPPGASLLELKVVQKEPASQRYNRQKASKYQSAKGSNSAAKNDNQEISREKLLETYIDIQGIAPSDFDVATYIERLTESKMMDNVALVESKEHKKRPVSADQQEEDTEPVLRQFKLTSTLTKGVHLSKEDINKIRKVYEQAPIGF
ncbi:MAG: PilN domain-containing protein [Planctomycetota bacterium]|jgi:Tfp pilus assembly protein PilN